MDQQYLEQAYFAAGCFWCTEAVFASLKGVARVIPGYAGGGVPHPSYEQVSGGGTGHAETACVVFDPKTIPYEKLVEVFFLAHDPTSLDRQGGDIGSQYRSEIFFSSPAQQRAAQLAKADLERKAVFDAPIVTRISPLSAFYPAENYHWEYYKKNPLAPYCRAVIQPKLAKLKKNLQAWYK